MPNIYSKLILNIRIMRVLIFTLILSIISTYRVIAQQHISSSADENIYFPLPDSLGGWRTLKDAKDIRQIAKMDKNKLDSAFNFIRTTTRNGGLLVVRHGWLVYEKYFGKGQRDATPNLASCGKSFTGISIGILMHEHPELFPNGLDQKIFTPKYMPSKAFPLPDPRMADIKLGQLLSFTAGIRGNNPVYIYGKPSTISPVGPDGWYAVVDDYALGIKDGNMYGGTPFSTKTLWCDPGEGYSYATASAHDASIMLRHVTGMELKDYVKIHLAKPLGWGKWGWGYMKGHPLVTHTPGGGGIALRSTDMLRFCYLLLHHGRWKQKQIVPEQYIEKATQVSPYNPHYPFSLMFNVNSDGHIKGVPRDAYWKMGSGGHCFYVIPSLDMIIWKLGGRNGQYSVNNTGIPEPKPLSDVIHPINNGRDHDAHADDIKILRMVLNAVVDKDRKDFLHTFSLPGQIIQDPDHPNKLVYNKDDNKDGRLDPFFLCGPGDPEGFLYRGRRNRDGTRDGDQMKLIRKLEKNGGNSIYLIAVRTNGGDGEKDHKDHPAIYPDNMQNPWIDQDPENGLNDKILDQWEKWFDEMDKRGIVIYFFFYDDGINVAEQFGWSLDANGNLNSGEKKFIQTLVRRFRHHKNLIWCIMEEGQEMSKNWQQHISKIAAAIHEADPYNHIIASHQLAGNEFYHKDDPYIDQFAIQTSEDKVSTVDDLHNWLLKAYDDSKGRYSLVMAEDWMEGNVSIPEENREEVRQRNWAAAMSGAYVMVFGMDIANTPKTWLNDCKNLQTFFEGTRFNQMSPIDSLAYGETEYVLADEGYDYIFYSSHAHYGLGIKNSTKGKYLFTWLNCINGKRVVKNMNIHGGDQIWKKPSGFGSEVALYIHRIEK